MIDFLEGLLSVVFSLVWFAVIGLVFLKASGGLLGSGKSVSLPKRSTSVHPKTAEKTSAEQKIPNPEENSANGRIHVGGLTVGRDVRGMEDRENDWLARQIREEAKAAKSNSLDLGAAHNSHAEEIHRQIRWKSR